MIKTGIVSPNSVTLGPFQDFYIVGFRTDSYGENEWLVRITPRYENALEYYKNEKSRDNFRYNSSHHQYKIWKCRLNRLMEMPLEAECEKDYSTLDY